MRKTFAKVLSLTVTMLLILGTIMMPVSAAVPEAGLSVGNFQIYSASNAYSESVSVTAEDGTETTTETPWVTGEDTTWKFAVSGLNDTFKASSTGFAAPVAEPVEGGFLKLSWTAPEGAEGKATVKVIGNNYNKEVIVTGNSVTLGDVELGNIYHAQVTVGDVSSEIRTYNHIYSPTYVTNSVFTRKNNIQSREGRGYDYMFVSVADYAELINENSGLLVKVGTEITSNANVISYYDNHVAIDENGNTLYTGNDGNIYAKTTDEDGNEIYLDANGNTADVSGIKLTVKRVATQYPCDSENSPLEAISMATGDVSIAFHTILQLPILDDQGGMAVGDFATLNSESDESPIYFDINGGTLIEKTRALGSKGEAYITHTDDMKSQSFKSGYIFIPFEMLDEASLTTIRENGAVNLNVTRQRYFAKNLWENNNTFSWNILAWNETDSGNTSADDVNYWFDRTVNFEEVAFISDYDAFVEACLDKTTYNEGKASEYSVGEFSYDALTAESENKMVYLDTTTVGTVGTVINKVNTQYTLSNENVVSTYTADINDIQYTTALGEKMSLGFTAPQDGTYEVSAPITSTVENGVHYRLIKESAAGVKTVIQAEKIYAGEERFVLDNISLVTGDTLWFEAWADKEGTVIDIGVPTLVRLDKATKNGEVSYNSANYARTYYSDYVYNGSNASEQKSVWEFGAFQNPFKIGETTYSYAKNSVKCAADTAGIVIEQDVFGMADMQVNDDAAALYNALEPYESIRSSSANNSFFTPESQRMDSSNLNAKRNLARNLKNGVGILQIQTGTKFFSVFGFARSQSGTDKDDEQDAKTNTDDAYGVGVWSNTGIYQQFTAPSNGNAVLKISRGSLGGGKLVVLKNSTVVATLTESAEVVDEATGEVTAAVNATDLNVTVDNVEAGDTITFCVCLIPEAKTGNPAVKKDASVEYIVPVVAFTPAAVEESKVDFGGEVLGIMNDTYANGSVITFPTTAKNGAIFQGWKDAEGNLYAAGTEYTVNADVAFTADYIYYGDLDADGVLAQGADLSILRKLIIKVAEIEGAVNAELTGDIDADGEISLIDLIKMKKMSAGMDVTVGAK